MRLKAMKTIPRKVGMMRLRRVNRNRSIIRPDHKSESGGTSPPLPASPVLAGLVDALEDMGSEGVDLEAGHLLAHRHIDHRMGDRKPGRVLMKNLLRLHVERRALLHVRDL